MRRSSSTARSSCQKGSSCECAARTARKTRPRRSRPGREGRRDGPARRRCRGHLPGVSPISGCHRSGRCRRGRRRDRHLGAVGSPPRSRGGPARGHGRAGSREHPASGWRHDLAGGCCSSPVGRRRRGGARWLDYRRCRRHGDGPRDTHGRRNMSSAVPSGVPLEAGLDEVRTDSGIPVRRVYTRLDVAGGPEALEERLGLPGAPPYTRGPYPSMYRGQLWTMRQFAGFGSPEETNARFRFLLAQGQTALSVAFDLPTQLGYDSEHPMARPEVGRVGVAIDTAEDMVDLFDGLPLDRLSVNFTINATAPIILATYLVAAERQGADPARLAGTLQNDILKEFLARKAFVLPPEPALRLVA